MRYKHARVYLVIPNIHMKVGKKDASSVVSARLNELRKNKKATEKRKMNYINIRNRALRLNMSETMTPQKIDQMRMFLCLNKSSLYSLHEKHKQALKEIGYPLCYRHPYASLLLDLTKNKNKLDGNNHVDFLKWQTKRLGISKTSAFLKQNISISIFQNNNSFNGSDIISTIEKLNRERLNKQTLYSSQDNQESHKENKIDEINKLVEFVYRESTSSFGFRQPMDLSRFDL